MKIVLWLSLAGNVIFFFTLLIGFYTLWRRERYKTAYEYKANRLKTIKLPSGNCAMIRPIELADLTDVPFPLFDVTKDQIEPVIKEVESKTNEEFNLLVVIKGCVQPRLVLDQPDPGKEMLISDMSRDDRLVLVTEILQYSGLWKVTAKKK